MNTTEWVKRFSRCKDLFTWIWFIPKWLFFLAFFPPQFLQKGSSALQRLGLGFVLAHETPDPGHLGRRQQRHLRRVEVGLAVQAWRGKIFVSEIKNNLYADRNKWETRDGPRPRSSVLTFNIETESSRCGVPGWCQGWGRQRVGASF